MNTLKSLLWVLLLAVSTATQAQESAIYRDEYADYKRGMEFYSKSLYGKAEEEFQKVLDRHPSAQQTNEPEYVMDARLYKGMSALKLNRPDAEMQLLDFIGEYEPSAVANRATIEIAGYYYEQEEYKKAIEYFDMAKTLDLPDQDITEVKFKLGYSYFITKDFKNASSIFKQIKEIQDQYYYPSNYYFGISEFFQNKYPEALESFKRVTFQLSS
jgi:tetratricopeptide (TPR) repeat protein